MPSRTIRITLLASLILATPALADGSTALIARKACMKANTSAFNALLPMFKGEKPFEPKAVPSAVDRISLVCKGWPDFWPRDSQSVPGLETRAAPEIWSDTAGFQQSSATYFATLKALAEVKDEAGFKTNFLAFGETCKSCHETYRGPEN